MGDWLEPPIPDKKNLDKQLEELIFTLNRFGASIKTIEKLEDLSEQLIERGDDRNYLRFQLIICKALLRNGKYIEVIRKAEPLLSTSKVLEEHSLAGQFALHLAFANFYLYENQLDDIENVSSEIAKEYSELALQNFEYTGETSLLASAHDRIACVSEFLDDDEYAIENQSEALSLYSDLLSSEDFELPKYFLCQIRLAKLFRKTGKNRQSKILLEQCIEEMSALFSDFLSSYFINKLSVVYPLAIMELGITSMSMNEDEPSWSYSAFSSRLFFSIDSLFSAQSQYSLANLIFKAGNYRLSKRICSEVLKVRDNIYPQDGRPLMNEYRDNPKLDFLSVLGSCGKNIFTEEGFQNIEHLLDMWPDEKRSNPKDTQFYAKRLFSINDNTVEMDLYKSQEIGNVLWNARVLSGICAIAMNDWSSAIEELESLKQIIDYLPSISQAEQLDYLLNLAYENSNQNAENLLSAVKAQANNLISGSGARPLPDDQIELFPKLQEVN